jgi:hypothetical protein
MPLDILGGTRATMVYEMCSLIDISDESRIYHREWDSLLQFSDLN